MSINDINHLEEHGYRRDREQRLREVAGGRDCLSLEAANQIRHLKAENERLRRDLEAIRLRDCERDCAEQIRKRAKGGE